MNVLIIVFITSVTKCSRHSSYNINNNIEPPYKSTPNKQQHLFLNNLITKMTLKEKIGQLTQINLIDLIDVSTQQLNTSKLNHYISEYNVGSFFNLFAEGDNAPPPTARKWVTLLNTIQQRFQNTTRMKIPMIYAIDSIHGANYILEATLFPHQASMAATFNRTLIRLIGDITAKDNRAVGIHWNFSPILDIAVNKQWGRVYETFGEDPYLASELGKEIIIGYQGYPRNLKSPTKVAATMKHFIGYSATRSGKDVDGSWMSDRIVNEYFRPPYDGAIEVGVATTMEAQSDISGDHIVSSKKYLNKLLRQKMKFDGLLVTDWGQIEKLHNPIKVASSIKEAVYLSMKLGSIDMSMTPNNASFVDFLYELVKEGRIPEDVVNKNVYRVLKLKQELGLFDNFGYVDNNSNLLKSIGSDTDNLVSLNAAREGVIMLKNENETLPINKNSKILVAGPTAKSLRFLNGGWTFKWPGPNDDTWFTKGSTIYDGIRGHIGNNAKYIDTVDIEGKKLPYSQKVDEAAKDCDYIVLCLGEANYVEYLGNIDDMNLPLGQRDLIDEALKTQKPVILLLSQGRPRVIGKAVDSVSAVLNGFELGPHGGEAFSDVLFGKVNPSGKLPLTYSNHPNDNTVNYYRRANEQYNVQWEFGHGLSFSKFKYFDIKLNTTTISYRSLGIEVSVGIQNVGDREGQESVLMFISDHYRSVSPEVKKLRGFEKVNLKPNESKDIKFEINFNDLCFYDLDDLKRIEAGKFSVIIGNSTKEFELDLGKEEFLILE